MAAELDAINAERRDVETRIRFEAEALVAEHPAGNALVLAAEGWHPGVIGIVASRIAERHHRPAVLIALEGDEGAGSGRSIPGFDLLGGLHVGASHLLRYGGHRAAAGLTIARGRQGWAWRSTSRGETAPFQRSISSRTAASAGSPASTGSELPPPKATQRERAPPALSVNAT